MNLAIIGTGHVGLVTGAVFAAKGHRVICVDNDTRKIKLLQKNEMPIYEPGLAEMVLRQKRRQHLSFSTSIKEGMSFGELIFIAVGTPISEGGAPDMRYVEGVCYEIARYLSESTTSWKEYRVIVEKSTVPVQTAQRIKKLIRKYAPGIPFDIVSNPEFLQEGTAIKTTIEPDRIVVGVESPRAEKIMRQLYANFSAPLIITDLNSAELIKHAANSFLATKISYINAVARVCELVGADVRQVARGLGLDKRIGPHFLKAGLGYGGYCLPKDVAAFHHFAGQAGYDFNLLNEVQKINLAQRDYLVRKIAKELRVIKGKKIGQLGLSFKGGTDDIRESPALAVARRLVEHGAKLQVYDPAVKQSALRIPHSAFKFCRSIYEAARGVHCLVIATDWEEFSRINLRQLKKVMAHPTIIDGRNLLDPQTVRQAGFTYRGVGVPL